MDQQPTRRRRLVLGALVVVLAAVLVCAAVVWSKKKKRNKQSAPLTKRGSKSLPDAAEGDLSETIFVVVCAGLGHSSAAVTCVAEALHAAKEPRRVRFGVHLCSGRGSPTDAAAFWRLVQRRRATLSDSLAQNVRVVVEDDPGGVEPARHAVLALFRAERWVLECDCQVALARNWDVSCLSQWLRARTRTNMVPLITHDPVSGRPPLHPEPASFPRFQRWTSHGTARWEDARCTSIASRPLPALVSSEAFVFGPSAMLSSAPHDPLLARLPRSDVTWVVAARRYCAGYDSFAPAFAIAYRPGWRVAEPAVLSHENEAVRKASYHRLWALMGMIPEGAVDLGEHSMPAARSLREFAEFTGVDCDARTVLPHARLGLTAGATASRGDEAVSRYGSWAAVVKHEKALEEQERA